MNPRVLFVDDEPRVLHALRHHLKSRSDAWDMEFFSDPLEALDRHKDFAFDVVITDLRMPGLDGFGLVEALRASSPTIIPIVLTGTADLAAAVKAINQSGVFRFYPKPTPAQELIDGIETAMANLARQSASDGDQNKLPAPPAIESEVSVFDHLRIGAIVVDEKMRVVFCNRMGADLMANGDGLTLGADGTCRASTADDTIKFRTLVDQATLGAAASDNCAADSVLPISRPSSKRPLAVVAFPYGRKGGDSRESRRLTVLLVHDPENFAGPTESVIAATLGLTVSEARLAKHLADGEILEEASRAVGLTVESGRTYLKRIFVKTGANRQADLVRMIFTASLSR